MVLDIFSYPRLTLDFHTNKRLIDEVVCLLYLLPRMLVLRLPSGCCSLEALAQQNCWIHNSLDEAYSEGTGPWHFVQASGGGTRAQGQLRARSVCTRHLCHRRSRGGSGHQSMIFIRLQSNYSKFYTGSPHCAQLRYPSHYHPTRFQHARAHGQTRQAERSGRRSLVYLLQNHCVLLRLQNHICIYECCSAQLVRLTSIYEDLCPSDFCMDSRCRL